MIPWNCGHSRALGVAVRTEVNRGRCWRGNDVRRRRPSQIRLEQFSFCRNLSFALFLRLRTQQTPVLRRVPPLRLLVHSVLRCVYHKKTNNFSEGHCFLPLLLRLVDSSLSCNNIICPPLPFVTFLSYLKESDSERFLHDANIVCTPSFNASDRHTRIVSERPLTEQDLQLK